MYRCKSYNMYQVCQQVVNKMCLHCLFFISLCYKDRVITTAYANYCGPVLPRYIDVGEGGGGNRSIRGKTLEARERSTTGTQLTRNTTPDLVSVMRGTTR